eukprot:CAMPEP_0202696318 /NCGR_PEP_ID=MMETSP1385-20130828/9609_1 /ASSEMBLY_ACC=CAM_ASM_000861 /TAXON_ID=933848 /ORGANISM="Elphidium margaritaceum" /LENGTH=168 /DNA_ID=CAMNT_0049352453 /DNA_START=40 /DNA_END=542 /DNA_ORIENTATION=-
MLLSICILLAWSSVCRAGLQTLTVDASFSFASGAWLILGPEADKSNGKLEIETASTYVGWAYWLNLQFDPWKFHPNHVSLLRLILDGSSDIVSTTDTALIVSISVGLAKYVSLKINLNNGVSNGVNHTIGPQCDAASVLLSGDVKTILEQNVSTNPDPRRTRTSADAS